VGAPFPIDFPSKWLKTNGWAMFVFHGAEDHCHCIGKETNGLVDSFANAHKPPLQKIKVSLINFNYHGNKKGLCFTKHKLTISTKRCADQRSTHLAHSSRS
jgi:hypothetical protein